MRDFNAEEWNAAKGTRKIELSAVHFIEITVSCSKAVQLLGVRGDKKVPFQSGNSFRFRGKVQGFDYLELKGTGQTEFGWRLRELPRQDGEPLNHDNPPAPPMPGNENMLLAMRRIFQQELRRNRSPVMEPEDLPDRYSIDDDDWEFEEELAERLQAERQAREAEASNRPEPPAPGTPATPSQRPAEAPPSETAPEPAE